MTTVDKSDQQLRLSAPESDPLADLVPDPVSDAEIEAVAEDAGAAAEAEVPLGKNRDFLLLWVGAGVAYIGSRVSAIAYTLLVFWNTGSAAQASFVSTAALLPSLFMQLPAGLLVDRWGRRKVMIGCDIGRIIAIGSVIAAVALGHVWLPQLMVVAFVEGSLTILYLLAERAAVFTVVEEEQIGSAMSRNEARNQAAGLVGQPLGTLLFAVFRWVPFASTVIAHFISLGTLMFIRRDLSVTRSENKRTPVGDLAEGFKFVWSQLYLRRALMLIAASNILFQILALGLIVIIHRHGGSATTIGLVIAASGVGGMFGALHSGIFMRRFGIRRIIMGVNLAWALLMTSIAFEQTPVGLAVIFTLMLYGGGVANVAGIVYTMRTTPGNMQGRVGSIANLLASGGNSLGALVAGVLLDSYTSKTVMFIVGAVMAALAVLAFAWFGGRKAAALEKELHLAD
ncbi:MFS transporter [Actinospica robiniae]|uniref:MFS transporter n=1 Tax=Actinospica robiniae TaxID=304901 RepID=UPI000403F4B8|nr:MFS transporter [Actinospica robiniae]